MFIVFPNVLYVYCNYRKSISNSTKDSVLLRFIKCLSVLSSPPSSGSYKKVNSETKLCHYQTCITVCNLHKTNRTEKNGKF